jgi:hypothetical protein
MKDDGGRDAQANEPQLVGPGLGRIRLPEAKTPSA